MTKVKDETVTTTNLEDKTVVSTGDTITKRQQQVPPALVVLVGPVAYQGKQFSLKDGMVIGRAPESSIFIDDRSLSRSHARIDIKPTGVEIVDLGSTNKTFVNNNQLAVLVPCALRANDQIKTGNIIFKFLEQGSIEAITNQQLFDRANRDALTGAYSKGALLTQAPEALKRSDTLRERISLVVFDIDFFKKINDTYGHPGGDFVLKELGRIIGQNLIRPSDYFARYGGEEFVLLLPGAKLQTAAEIAERIRSTIQGTDFHYEGKK
ncbi:MAG: GGDEF domain-containing protein, partial [Bdellovibrionaceae bacterium]|nr:GGDEF domain-containing protein [Pseudobdellovibrionaceae bacterium]